MNAKSLSAWALCLLTSISFSFATSAENYVGIQVGGRFANKISNVRGDVTNVTLFPPVTLVPVSLGNFTGTDSSDMKLDETISFGAKIGHYFDKMPFIGIEGDINFSKPDLYPQNLTLTNSAFPATIPPQYERRIKVNDLQGGVSLMLRYPAFKRVMPYVGIGPQVHWFNLRGTGVTENPLGTLFPAQPATLQLNAVNQDKIAVGLQAKTGVRVALTKHLAVDAEYKFNYSPVRFQARNLDNISGSYTSHEIGAALVYRFGKIRW